MSERDIFIAALQKDQPAERSAYLDEACVGDAALRERVEALLRAHASAGAFAEGPATGALAEGAGGQIGPYRLLEPIGEGGMGVVWMAEQREPIRRLVALKVIKPGMDTAQVIARFEAERQALALMDHPNIARVFDADTTEGGRPYFVMELVKGIPITRYCDEQRLTPRERLELFVPVCQAIQHAHQKGVLHRDIKPSNVLVASYDGRPVPKVIDFGVAKAMGQQLTERTLFTGFGGLVGTLEYMSPEQAEFNALDIDTRSDIYSLGVLLYELLTGTTPLTKQRLKQAAVMEVLRLIREEEPPKPSTRLSESKESLASISAQRRTEPARLTRVVSGELDWIVMRALEKDRGRRYETANGLAQDVRRYLADEPVQAGPPSATYRLRKFLRRNKGPALAAAALLLAVVVGVVCTTAGLIEAQRQRDQADRARGAEAAERREAEDRLARLYVSNGARLLDDGDWLGSLPWFAEALRLEQSDPERAEAHRRRLGALLRQGPRLLQVCGAGARSAALSPDGRHVALWSGGESSGQLAIRDLFTGEALPLTLAEKRFLQAWFSPDGRYLITSQDNGAGGDFIVQIHEAATGKALPLQVRGASQGQVSPDGRRLVTAGSAKDALDKQEVRLWDLATGTEQTPPALRALRPTSVLFGPAGRFAMVTGTEEASRVEIHVWATDTGAAVGTPIKPGLSADDPVSYMVNNRRHFVPRMAFRPDGARLATSYAKRARVWDAATGQPVTPVLTNEDYVGGLQFSHDGSQLLTTAGRKVFVWHATTGALVHTYPEWTPQYGLTLPGGPVVEPRFSPDSRCVLLDSDDQARLKNRGGPRAWDLGANRWATPTMTHARPVYKAEYTPDARRLFTINRGAFDEGGEARLWDLLPPPRPALDLRCWGRGGACLSPDGRRVVVDTGAGLQVHDLASGRPVSPVFAGDSGLPPGFRQWPYDASCLGFSGDGRFLFVVRPEKGPQRRHFQVRVYEVATGAAVGQPCLTDSVGLSGAAVSPDGSRFLLTCGLPQHAAPGESGVNMAVRLWDTHTGQLVATLNEFDKDRLGPIEATFSPDGRLVVGLFYQETPGQFGATGTVRLWDAATGRPVPPSPNVAGDRLWEFGYQISPYPDVRPKHLAFGPDGRRLVLTFGGNHAYLCTLGDDAPPVVLEHHQAVNAVGFSPDGRHVVTASNDLTARVWDAATGEPATPPLEHDKRVVAAAFQADGRLLTTVTDKQDVRVWDVRTGAPVAPPLPGGSEQVVLLADGRLLTFLRRPGGPFGPEGLSWDLTPDARPVDDLVLLAQLLSGHHIDASGALVPLDVEALRAAWERLRVRYPQDFALSEQALLAWHRQEAGAAEGRADWSAVVFHAGRLLRADAGQAEFYVRRGRAYARLGLHESALADYAEAVRLRPADVNGWAGRAAAHAALRHDEQAVADYTQVIQRSADNQDAWLRRGEARARLGRLAEADADFVKVIELQEAQAPKGGGGQSAWQFVGRDSPALTACYGRALLHLARGDEAGYRQVCEAFLGHFRKAYDDGVLGRVAWTCALGPDAVKDLAEAERMVQQPLRWETERARQEQGWRQRTGTAAPAEPDHLTTAGALAYRRGNFKQAVTLLTQTRKEYGTEGSAWDWLFLAMAHQRLGQRDEARQWLRRAVEWADRAAGELAWDRRLELQVLRRQAEALVN